MQCKRGFLPWVFKLAELIFLKLTIYLKQAIASLIKLPFLSGHWINKCSKCISLRALLQAKLQELKL
jgi:hypothetical protein